jgi:ubiquinone/menaquinone biosynthesis C-methylase UbiE
MAANAGSEEPLGGATMKSAIIAPGPIYTFLSYCNATTLEREVLDCGAGGAAPPLAAFAEHGYQTHGIDISRQQLKRASRFSTNHGMDLDLTLGDMRDLPFGDSSLSFVYSYGSICHMTKREVGVTMGEIERVLKRGGLCYVSFLSVEDGRYGQGPQLGSGEYAYDDGDHKGLHCYYVEGEPDDYFRNFTRLRTERRRTERWKDRRKSIWGELDYIARKR